MATISENTQPAQRNIILCGAPYAEAVHFHDGNNLMPEVGDTLFSDNHTDTLLSEVRAYFTFVGGFYVRVNAMSVVDEVGLCSERLCFLSPSDLFVHSTTDIFEFTFEGIAASYTTTTSGSTVEELDTRQEIQNATIEYVVQGARRYPSEGTFSVNARNDARELYFNAAIVDNNVDTIQEDTTEWQPARIGTVDADGVFVNDTFTLPAPNNATRLSEAAYADYNDENPEDLQVIITSVCYRGISFEGNSIAWTSATPLGGDAGITCGETVNNAVYYDPNLTPFQFFEDPDLETPWASTKGAGQFGFAFIDPSVPEVEGGGIVSQISTISADGTETGSFTCIDSDDTYFIELGYTGLDENAAKQTACNAAEAMNSELLVSYYSDEPLDNFGDQGPDELSPGNPPRTLRTANGNNAPDGFYIGPVGDGDGGSNILATAYVIRRLVGGVFQDYTMNDACSFAITATLTATDNVIGGTPIIAFNPVTGQQVVELGDTFNVTASILPPAGFNFTTAASYVATEAGVEQPRVTGTSYTYTGLITSDIVDGTVDEPVASVIFSGTVAVVANPVFQARLTATNNISGASLSFSGGTQSGNFVFVNGENPTSFNLTATVTPTSGRRFVSGSVTEDGSLGDGTRNHSGTLTTSNNFDSVIFAGSTELIPVTEDFTHTATVSPTANAEISYSPSQTVTLSPGGTGSITATVSADPTFEIVSITPANGQSFSFSYGDNPKTATTDYTVSIAHPTFTNNAASTAMAACVGADGSSRTFDADASSLGSASELYASSTSTLPLNETVFISDGTSSRRWNGSVLDSAVTCVIINHDPISLGYDASDSLAACEATASGLFASGSFGTSILLYSSQTSNTFASAGFYSDGSNWIEWDGAGSVTSNGSCFGVFWTTGGGTETTTQPAGTLTGPTSAVSGTVRIVGRAASITGNLTTSLTGGFNDLRRWSSSITVNGTSLGTTDGQVEFANPNQGDLRANGSTTLNPGSYSWSVGAGTHTRASTGWRLSHSQ